MATDKHIYEFFGLQGAGKTTLSQKIVLPPPGTVLHRELLAPVERLGRNWRISLHYTFSECWHFLKMAQCVDRRIDHVTRRRIWQAEKNCLEYRFFLKDHIPGTVINDQGIVQAALSICFDREIRRPECFLRHLKWVLERYPIQLIWLDCPPEEAARRIRLRNIGQDKGFKYDSRMDLMEDEAKRLTALRNFRKNIDIITTSCSLFHSCNTMASVEENVQKLTEKIGKKDTGKKSACLQVFLDQMTQEKLPWLVWCGCDHLEASFHGEGDVDLLIDEPALDRARQLLHEAGFLSGRPSFCRSSVNAEHWYGLDPDTGRLTHLHLHRQMEKEGFYKQRRVFLPLKEAFRFRVFHDGIYVQHPVLETLLLLCQAAVGDIPKVEKMISKRDYLLEALKNTDAATVLMDLELTLTSDELAEMLRVLPETPNVPEQVLNLYRLQTENPLFPFIRRHKPLMTFLSPFGQDKKCLSPCGFTFAFAGQDGAGKSTVSDEISRWLGQHFSVSCRYMGCGSGRSSLRKKMLKHFPDSCSAPVDILRWMIRCGEAVAVARRAKRMLKKAEKDRLHGCITILDRMPQNCFPGYNDGPKLRKKAENENLSGLRRKIVLCYAAHEERLLEEAMHHPIDLVLLLNLSPEESVHRKPENRLDTIRTKHDLLHRTNFAALNTITVDAEQPYADELREIKRILFEMIP